MALWEVCVEIRQSGDWRSQARNLGTSSCCVRYCNGWRSEDRRYNGNGTAPGAATALPDGLGLRNWTVTLLVAMRGGADELRRIAVMEVRCFAR